MALVRSWVTLSALTSLVPLASLGLGFAAAACGGSVEVNFVGEDDDGGEGGGSSTCGDGDVDDEETCDDENTEAGDGCNDACATEPGWVCSGEPSSCAQTCGNDELDEGEACEDSNVEDGDGCSASCQVEGSCDAPVDLVFEEQSNGTELARVESSTAGGGRQVGAADCGGDEAGGGADRVYRLVLEEASDVQIRVSGGFNSVIRLLRADACDTTDEVSCRNAGDGNADETLTAPNLEPGTYHVVVDGAASSSQGTFTLSVTRACPLENVRIHRFGVASYYDIESRIILRNYSDSCGVALSRLGFALQGNTTELTPVELPDEVLNAGDQLNLVTSGEQEGDVLIPDEPYMYYSYGTGLLCRGECSESGSNVFDAVVTGANHGDVPEDITFDAPLTVLSNNALAMHSSYARVATEGRYPDFVASDWSTWFEIDPDRMYPSNPSSTSIWPIFGSPTHSFEEDTTYGTVLVVDGPAAASVGYHGFNLPAPNVKPTYMRYRVKKPITSTYVPMIGIGMSAGEPGATDGFYVLLDETILYSYPGSGSSFNTTIAAATWHTIEYRNITWPEGESAHLDLYVNGTLVQEDVSLGSATDIRNVLIASYNQSGNAVYLADLVLR